MKIEFTLHKLKSVLQKSKSLHSRRESMTSHLADWTERWQWDPRATNGSEVSRRKEGRRAQGDEARAFSIPPCGAWGEDVADRECGTSPWTESLRSAQLWANSTQEKELLKKCWLPTWEWKPSSRYCEVTTNYLGKIYCSSNSMESGILERW